MNTIHERMRDAELDAERLHAEFAAIARAIHYPECWDTVTYPTLAEALDEMYAWFKCHNDDCQSGLVKLPRTAPT